MGATIANGFTCNGVGFPPAGQKAWDEAASLLVRCCVRWRRSRSWSEQSAIWRRTLVSPNPTARSTTVHHKPTGISSAVVESTCAFVCPPILSYPKGRCSFRIVVHRCVRAQGGRWLDQERS